MASIKSKKVKAPKRKVKHVHIELGANGFSVQHHMEPKPRNPGGLSMYDADPSPKPSYFTDHAQMMNHVGGLTKPTGGDEAEEGNEAA